MCCVQHSNIVEAIFPFFFLNNLMQVDVFLAHAHLMQWIKQKALLKSQES